MSDWWTYSLSDFLMFSPQAYWRLVARYNQAWWPAQLAGTAACLGVLLLARRQQAWARRATLLLLAAAWAWVGWAFQWQRYAEIFLAAPWLAAGCAAQALLLAGTALLAGGAEPRTAWRHAGAVLVAAALIYPLLAPLQGRGWSAAEVFGFMPDPTAIATLGALLAMEGLRPWQRVLLAVLPTLSLLLGGATRWLLQ